jgi:tetratricopeptide (TPR) repeat protein
MAQDSLLPHHLVLFLAANPTNTQPLRLDEEVRAIRQQLRRSVLTLDSCWAVRPLDMQQEILRLKPQIVHFSGHGIGQEPAFNFNTRTLNAVGASHLPQNEEGLAFIEDGTGQSALVDTETLADLFKNFQNYVQCVVLNGCYSEVQAEAIARHIPYVIGMRHAILDRAAIEFSKGFYNALAEGETIESAFNLGKSAIRLARMPDYQFPVLHKPKNLEAQGLANLSRANLNPSKYRVKHWIVAGGTLVGLLGSTAIGISQLSSRQKDSELCQHQTQKSNRLVVAIADFQSVGNNPTDAAGTETDSLNILQTRLPAAAIACRIKAVNVTTDDQARNLGKKSGAAIVIWGELNSQALEVNFTTVDKPTPSNFILPKADAQKFSVLIQSVPEIILVDTVVALSKIYEDKGSYGEARKILHDSLAYLESKNIDLSNTYIAKEVSDSYWNLGRLYLNSADYSCEKAKEDCIDALDAFARASDIYKRNFEALKQQGYLYERLEKTERAVEIYTQIINSSTDPQEVLDARGYRATVYFKIGNFQQAIADAKLVSQVYENEYTWLVLLGQAQFLAGEINAAKATFARVDQVLEQQWKEKSTVADDMKKFSQAHPDLATHIQQIVLLLQTE